jgi:hypothetical protein
MDKDSLTLGVLGEWPARSHPARGNGARLPQRMNTEKSAVQPPSMGLTQLERLCQLPETL